MPPNLCHKIWETVFRVLPTGNFIILQECNLVDKMVATQAKLLCKSLNSYWNDENAQWNNAVPK